MVRPVSQVTVYTCVIQHIAPVGPKRLQHAEVQALALYTLTVSFVDLTKEQPSSLFTRLEVFCLCWLQEGCIFVFEIL